MAKERGRTEWNGWGDQEMLIICWLNHKPEISTEVIPAGCPAIKDHIVFSFLNEDLRG
jgi:hypothetical protein